MPWAPTDVAPLPGARNSYITFGCFNNTAKLNAGVSDLWARILTSVPDSRLVLKWRTLADEPLCETIRAAFFQRGVDPLRLELRPASFHVDVLKEYADIDICLDPFPFTGGLTSCEALWMGVPVITWPQSRVVSRNLEDTLIALYRDIEQRENTEKILLNVGAGHPKSGARIPQTFQSKGWKEIRLDIDPVNEPDILGTMLDMPAVEDESVDAIYSSHNIEHLYPDEIPVALKEFLRVLKPEGFAVITCPDLQAAAQMIAEDKLMETAYNSPAGPVTPFDIIYSHRQFTGRDKPFMRITADLP